MHYCCCSFRLNYAASVPSDVTSSTSPANPQGMPTLRRRTAEPSTSLRPTSLPRITVPEPAPWLHRRRHPPLLSTLSHPSSLATLASRRGPSQHKGEPENHAQALEASPSRALTRANQTHGTPRPHHPPAPSAGCCASGSGRGVSAPNGSGRPEPAHRAPGADSLPTSHVCATVRPWLPLQVT